MAQNSEASLNKLTCTDYVDFGKNQLKLLQRFWSGKDSNYFDVNFKFLKKDDTKKFLLVQCFRTGEEDFNQFHWLRTQLVNGAENFAIQGNLSSVLKPTLSKDMDEQLKLVHKMLTQKTEQTRRFLWLCCGTMWPSQRNHKLNSNYFARNKEDDKFQQFFYMRKESEELIF